MYPSIFLDETNSSRSIIIPHINPPEIVSLPSLWREKKKRERRKQTPYAYVSAHALTHTHARSPCGGRGHWLTDSFGINAKHEEAHSLLQPRAASSRRKVEHRPRILVSLCRLSRLSSLLSFTGDRALDCAIAREESPKILSSCRGSYDNSWDSKRTPSV